MLAAADDGADRPSSRVVTRGRHAGTTEPARPRGWRRAARACRENSRGAQEPPSELNDRPDHNVAYDQVVKGDKLTRDDRARAERESPVADDD